MEAVAQAVDRARAGSRRVAKVILRMQARAASMPVARAGTGVVARRTARAAVAGAAARTVAVAMAVAAARAPRRAMTRCASNTTSTTARMAPMTPARDRAVDRVFKLTGAMTDARPVVRALTDAAAGVVARAMTEAAVRAAARLKAQGAPRTWAVAALPARARAIPVNRPANWALTAAVLGICLAMSCVRAVVGAVTGDGVWVRERATSSAACTEMLARLGPVANRAVKGVAAISGYEWC